MPDVIEQLRRYADAVEPTVPTIAVRPRGRRRVVLLAAALSGVALLSAVVVLTYAPGDDDGVVVDVAPTGPGGVTTSTPRSDRVPAPGTWGTIPEAPIIGRTGAVGVATDDELFVWGGHNGVALDDGAAYDFDAGTWRTVAKSPLARRTDAVAVWTGTEVLVWGGVGSTGDRLLDGAAYDPDSDTWRALDSRLLGATAGHTAAAWTGDELVLVGVFAPGFVKLGSDTFALDPASGEWRALDHLPNTSDRFPNAQFAAWTGTEVLVATFADGSPVTIDGLDPSAGERGAWGRTIVTDLPSTGLSAGDVAWTGSRLVVVGGTDAGIVFDPATGQTLEIGRTAVQEYDSSDEVPAAEAKGEATHLAPPAVAVGEIVAVGGRWLDARTGVSYAMSGPEEPETTARNRPVAVAHDGVLYVWGGDVCPDARCTAAVVDPETGLIWSPPEPGSGAGTAEPGSCDPITWVAPIVGHIAVAYLPPGFDPEGPVEHTAGGGVDEIGTSERTLHLVDSEGRRIEVVDFDAFDPEAHVAQAHLGAPSETREVPTCVTTRVTARDPLGRVTRLKRTERRVEASATPDRVVAGAMTSEYAGFLVVGGPGVTLDEVLAVASGLRM